MGSGGLGREGGVSRASGIGGSLGAFSRGVDGTIASSGAPSATKIGKALNDLLGHLERRYILSRFCSAALHDTVRAIFLFEIEAVVNRTWDWVEKTYGVDGSQRCLARFVNELVNRLPRNESTEPERGFARQCAEDFFVTVVGNKMPIYLNGNSAQVLKVIDQHRAEFQHVLTRCIASGISRLSQRFSDRLPQNAIDGIEQWSWAHALKICNRFRERYVGKTIEGRQIGMQQMLYVLNTDKGAQEWFIREIRSLE